MATFEFGGVDIPVPEQGFASEATLKRLADIKSQGLGKLNKEASGLADSLEKLRKTTNDLNTKYPRVVTGFEL